MTQQKVALVTGAAKRIGKQISTQLHQQGYTLIVHYNQSKADAEALVNSFNQLRNNSATLVQGDLNQPSGIKQIVNHVQQQHKRLDVLVNNASRFYPTKVNDVTEDIWNDLMASNLKAPFFLIQGLTDLLAQHQGCVVNIVDIHAQRPLLEYPVYCMAKAGLSMLTKSLSQELAPKIRVNGIAPGAILWHENELSEQDKSQVISEISLQRLGSPSDIAQAVQYLVEAKYVTGHILSVDGGRSNHGGKKA